jgi:hypothetical protein
MTSDSDWPEAKWTSRQRAWMEARRRLDIRYRHQWRLAEWKKRQQRVGEWVSFADIADWCARKPGSVGRDEDLRVQAGSDLLQAVEGGEFNRAGRLCVAYIPPWHSVCREPIRFRLDIGQVRWPIRVNDLAYFWAPRDLCARWFAARPDMAPMPGLMTTAPQAPRTVAAAPAAASPAAPPLKKAGSSTLQKSVEEYIAREYSEGRQPTLSGLYQVWDHDGHYAPRGELRAEFVKRLGRELRRGRPKKIRNY